eukprot:Pgem_evm2s1957
MLGSKWVVNWLKSYILSSNFNDVFIKTGCFSSEGNPLKIYVTNIFEPTRWGMNTSVTNSIGTPIP